MATFEIGRFLSHNNAEEPPSRVIKAFVSMA